jgi:hypothetical protein
VRLVEAQKARFPSFLEEILKKAGTNKKKRRSTPHAASIA